MRDDPPLPDDPAWLGEEAVKALHDKAIEEFGGQPGHPADPDELGGAVARPRMLAHYQDPSLRECAAQYAVAFAQAQIFPDGNKRTAAYSVRAFLRLNGYLYDPPQDEETEMYLALANHRIDREEFSEWLQDHIEPIGEADE